MGNCLVKPENGDLTPTKTAIIVEAGTINIEPFEFGYVVQKSAVQNSNNLSRD